MLSFLYATTTTTNKSATLKHKFYQIHLRVTRANNATYTHTRTHIHTYTPTHIHNEPRKFQWNKQKFEWWHDGRQKNISHFDQSTKANSKQFDQLTGKTQFRHNGKNPAGHIRSSRHNRRRCVSGARSKVSSTSANFNGIQ